MDNSTFNIENKEVKEPKKPVFELNNSFSENRFYIKSKEVIELIGRGIKKIDCQTYPSKYMVTEKALEKLREKYEMKFEPLF